MHVVHHHEAAALCELVLVPAGIAGIFATDGSSQWGNANRVYVKYCSSDLWSGDVGASAATFGYAFRGARIVAAVVNELMENQASAIF